MFTFSHHRKRRIGMKIGTERRDEQRWLLRASVSEAGVSEIGARIGKLEIAGKPWAAPLD